MRTFLVSLAAITLPLFLHSAEGRFRVWTNNEGRTISAEITALEGDTATLKMEDGREYPVSLSSLSEEDNAFAREWLARQETLTRFGVIEAEIGIPTEPIIQSPFDEDTPRTQKGEIAGWKAGIGEWRVEEGALIGDELPQNNHASSLTYKLEATDLIITAEVRLGEAEQITFACRDTVPPNLHLGRLYITRDKLWIQHMTGISTSTKSERLVTEEVSIDPEEWYRVTIEIVGEQFRAKVGDEEIEASHPRFSDAKGIVALVNRGQGARFRNVALWHAKTRE